jgi:hypothetical protein
MFPATWHHRVMVGRLVVALAMVIAHEASARVILDPPLVRRCPTGKSWGEIAACLSKGATVKVLEQRAGAKLVRLALKQSYGVESGLLLYVERRGLWRVGGYMSSYRTDFQLLGFEQIKVGKHKGYRIDIGQVADTRLVIDDISPVPAIVRTRRSLYCSGNQYRCSEVTTLCEVLVHGNTRFLFRGKVSIEDATVHVKGDTARAGPHCQVAPAVALDWDDE